MTSLSLLVLLCISIGSAFMEVTTEDELERLQHKTNALTVAFVDDDRIKFSTDSVVTMGMKSRATHTFQVQVVCFNQNDSKCIDIHASHSNDVIVVKDHPSVCFTCNSHEISADFGNDTFETNSSRIVILMHDSEAFEFIQEARVNITIDSLLIGVAHIRFNVANQSEMKSRIYKNNDVEVEVKVIRDPTILDLVFNICIYFIEVFEMFVFGTQLDFAQLKKTLRTPTLPFIGFLCQYIGMPLISFGIAKLSSSQPLAALGIFVAGICPGGGGSNIYTYLLGGDLPLSITMTTISTIMSLGMMPLWLYTLGSEFLEDGTAQATIPYTDILITLSIILVPLAAGILIHHKFPRAANVVEKVLTVVITVVALVVIVLGVYSYLYVFQLMSLKVVLIGCALPYIGIFLGGAVSIILGFSAEVVKTIAIETGLQNSAVGYILLVGTLAPPYGDIACVAPISAELISPIPPFVTAIVYLIYKKRAKKYDEVPQKFVKEIGYTNENINASIKDKSTPSCENEIQTRCVKVPDVVCTDNDDSSSQRTDGLFSGSSIS